MRPEITITDAQTGEVVVREMDDDEFAQYEIDRQRPEQETTTQ